jgi:hypothetical protein
MSISTSDRNRVAQRRRCWLCHGRHAAGTCAVPGARLCSGGQRFGLVHLGGFVGLIDDSLPWGLPAPAQMCWSLGF